jgi:hypothetical protein
MQEPLSVLFSLLNLAAHARWVGRTPVVTGGPREAWLSRLYELLPWVGINAWLWSAVFHSRDKPTTEKFDYFSAAFLILFQIYVALVRLWPLSHLGRVAAAILLSAIFAAHVSYLSLWSFDYGYNMAFSVLLGVFHNLLWIAWSVATYVSATRASPRRRRPPHVFRPVIILVVLSSLTALELLDFPAIRRTLDAHALWHLSTVPIAGLWYRFLEDDAEWWMLQRGADGKFG